MLPLQHAHAPPWPALASSVEDGRRRVAEQRDRVARIVVAGSGQYACRVMLDIWLEGTPS